MTVFVVLAVSLAVLALAVVVVAAVHLKRAGIELIRSVGAASQQLTALAEELQAEIAVAQLESESLARRSHDPPDEEGQAEPRA